MASTTVTWTRNVENQYEVSSKQHLLQIMNRGSLFPSAGEAPTDYWASSYLQTGDIDLSHEGESIVPIGSSEVTFAGEYDGAHFYIKNLSCASGTPYAGLFGCCDDGAILTRIRLSGVWTICGDYAFAGFVCAYLKDSSASDIEADFSEGTELGGGDITSGGGLIGSVQDSSVSNVTVRGSLVIGGGAESKVQNAGGVFGSLGGSLTTATMCRNLANYPGGITGRQATGGVVGHVSGATVSKCLNAMTGHVLGPKCGGVCGLVYFTCTLDILVNSMVGNVCASKYAGGLVGAMYVEEDGDAIAATRLLNFMKGSVLGSSGAGGVVGNFPRVSRYAFVSIAGTLVAMQGSIQSAAASEKIGRRKLQNLDD